MSYSVTYRFVEVKYPVSKSVPCAVCGKKIRRSTSFTQTINPFNKHKTGPNAGQVKTRGEIWQELAAEAEAWQPVATHPKCRGGE